jgi:GH24 family phage-related lysozyme (muramidase)
MGLDGVNVLASVCMDQNTINDLRANLIHYEGIHNHEIGTAYTDSRGVTTIGYGSNLEENYNQTFLENQGYDVQAIMDGRQTIAEADAKALFDHDMSVAISDARAFVPNFDQLNPNAQLVVAEMAYNLGSERLGEFENLQNALKAEDYDAAAKELHYEGIGQDRYDHLVSLMETPAVQAPETNPGAVQAPLENDIIGVPDPNHDPVVPETGEDHSQNSLAPSGVPNNETQPSWSPSVFSDSLALNQAQLDLGTGLAGYPESHPVEQSLVGDHEAGNYGNFEAHAWQQDTHTEPATSNYEQTGVLGSLFGAAAEHAGLFSPTMPETSHDEGFTEGAHAADTGGHSYSDVGESSSPGSSGGHSDSGSGGTSGGDSGS